MKRILLIEDDAVFADLLKNRLRETCQVEACSDGQSGYYAIYEFKPDVVLLDLSIQHMDALSLVGKMRVQKQFQKLPIFVLADGKTLGLAHDALAAGATEAFLKDESGAVASIVAGVAELMKPSLARPALRRAEPVRVPRPELAYAGGPSAFEDSPMFAPLQNSFSSAPAINAHANSAGHDSVRRVRPPLLEDLEVNAIFPAARNALAQDFLHGYGRRAHALRQDFIRYRTAAEPERAGCFAAFQETLSVFSVQAADSGFKALSFYLSLIHARVKQLCDSPGSITPYSLQVLASAMDMLTAMNNHLVELQPLNNLTPHALVVDDENVSRKTLCLGLENARVKTSAVDNPDVAILEGEAKPFDIIFLDVGLPKMNGFALCARLRTIPYHRKTPILFVTSLNDVKSRASSRVSGGNQFITKPVNMSELGINLWSLVIERRVLHNGHKS